MLSILRSLSRPLRVVDKIALGLFVISVLFSLTQPVLLAVSVITVLSIVSAAPRMIGLAFLIGASVLLLGQIPKRPVNFEFFDGSTDVSGAIVLGASGADASGADASGADASGADVSGTDVSGAVTGAVTGALPAISSAPNAEAFQGAPKVVKLPSESDDKGVHLDAGTTFLNAYKMLKPDQIAAMTKDTQDLLQTQRSLVSMLDTFAPLMADMGKITGMLGVSTKPT